MSEGEIMFKHLLAENCVYGPSNFQRWCSSFLSDCQLQKWRHPSAVLLVESVRCRRWRQSTVRLSASIKRPHYPCYLCRATKGREDFHVTQRVVTLCSSEQESRVWLTWLATEHQALHKRLYALCERESDQPATALLSECDSNAQAHTHTLTHPSLVLPQQISG